MIENIIAYMEQLITPLITLFIVFVISVLIHFFREEGKDKFFDENKFWRKYVVAHGMACTFALIYTCIFYFIPKEGTGVVAIVILLLFYGFLIKIVMTQNGDNGGYIEDMDGASGSIMYITSALSPIVFVVAHGLLGLICFLFYKREDESVEWKGRGVKCGIDCGEAIFASIIVKLIIPETFIANLWLNVIVISVFTLLLPFVNEWIYRCIENRLE